VESCAATGPGLWLRMQAAYDGWEASKRLKREIAKIPVVAIEPHASDATLAVRVVPVQTGTAS